MPTINDYQRFSETAFAAYASGLMTGPAGPNTEVLKNTAGLAIAQATAFDATWAVIEQSPSPGDGFSAVLLQNRSTQEKVLAVRGTESSLRFIDYITDVVNIGLLGSVTGMPQYSSLEAFYSSLLANGKLGATEQVTVTGHSLGGFLAQAFTARHSSVVAAAYTYNAPGFGGLAGSAISQMWAFMGVAESPAVISKIFNVRATDGISLTAGLGQVIGSVQQVRIEAGTADPIYYHSITSLTDTLSIYKIYSALQPSLTTDQVANLFISTSLGNRKLEGALDALRTVFVNSASNDAGRTPTGDREAFFTNLTAMTNATGPSSFQVLKGQVQLKAANSGFVAMAQAHTNTALAYRYAMLELQPFAVVADTDALNRTLYGNYAQALSLYDASTGTGNLTQQWMTDRAALLQALLTRNQQDNNTGQIYDTAAPAGQVTFFDFMDSSNPATPTLISTLRQGGTTLPNQYIAFGDDQANTLTGSDINYRIAA